MTILTAPTIDVRTFIPDEVIQELIKRISIEFKPKKVILFGSYAYGSPRPDSDVDVLVIMDTHLRETEQALRIRQAINPLFGVDILVLTPETLAKRINLGDSFLKEITSLGKIVYESLDA